MKAGQTQCQTQLAPEQAQQQVPEGVGALFNRDNFGLPQNEESVAVCRNNPNIVFGGTNDYRGILLDPRGNATGWHLSTDGGETLANEGLLPPVRVEGQGVPSGGDPVVFADEDCSNLYAASLNYGGSGGRTQGDHLRSRSTAPPPSSSPSAPGAPPGAAGRSVRL